MSLKPCEELLQLDVLIRFLYWHTAPEKFLELLYHYLGEHKTARLWTRAEADQLRRHIVFALPLVVSAVYDDALQCEVALPDLGLRIKESGTELYYQKTRGPDDSFIMTAYRNGRKKWRHRFPLLMFRVVEVLARLPENPIRQCKAGGCAHYFVTFHKKKIYCSPTCRSRHHTRKSRGINPANIRPVPGQVEPLAMAAP